MARGGKGRGSKWPCELNNSRSTFRRFDFDTALDRSL
jgi:hypothetical protein